MPAVVIILRAFDHLCSNRIQVDVAHQFAQIAIRLTKDRLVPALKQMADLLVLTVVILAVGGQHPLHDPADGIVLHLDQEVNVVRHQAIAVEIERELRLLNG